MLAPFYRCVRRGTPASCVAFCSRRALSYHTRPDLTLPSVTCTLILPLVGSHPSSTPSLSRRVEYTPSCPMLSRIARKSLPAQIACLSSAAGRVSSLVNCSRVEVHADAHGGAGAFAACDIRKGEVVESGIVRVLTNVDGNENPYVFTWSVIPTRFQPRAFRLHSLEIRGIPRLMTPALKAGRSNSCGDMTKCQTRRGPPARERPRITTRAAKSRATLTWSETSRPTRS